MQTHTLLFFLALSPVHFFVLYVAILSKNWLHNSSCLFVIPFLKYSKITNFWWGGRLDGVTYSVLTGFAVETARLLLSMNGHLLLARTRLILLFFPVM